MHPVQPSTAASETNEGLLEAVAAVQPLCGSLSISEKPVSSRDSSSTSVDQHCELQRCESVMNPTVLRAPSTTADQVHPVSDTSDPNACESPHPPLSAGEEPMLVRKASVGALWTLGTAAATIKDKAQQQKRALAAFQQRGGLVRWLHGDLEESDGLEREQDLGRPRAAASPIKSTPRATTTPPNSPVGHANHGLHTQASLWAPSESPSTNATDKPSLLDSLLDKMVNSVSSAPSSLPPSPSERARVTLRPTSDTTPSSALDEFLHQTGALAPHSKTPLSHSKATRQRAATTDQSPWSSTETPTLLKTRSDVSLSNPRPVVQSRFSLDEVLNDEWSCTVLWAYLYSSVVAERDHQHYQRLGFLLETSFRVLPLYESYAVATSASAVLSKPRPQRSKQSDYEILVMSLKRLRRRFLLHRGATTASEVPAASPIVSNLKNDLCMAVNRLNCERVADASDPDVKKVMALLQQLVREVELEFRVLATKSCSGFADSVLYRTFMTRDAASHVDIVSLLRASRIPFYQEPNFAPESLDLGSLLAKHASLTTSSSVFMSAGCQAFSFVAKGASSSGSAFKYTPLVLSAEQEAADVAAGKQRAELLHTIEPFLNPPGTLPSELAKPLAYNFIAGGTENRVYGAVLWFSTPRGDNLVQTGERSLTADDGVCIMSTFPLVDSLRHFLHCYWQYFALHADRKKLSSTEPVAHDNDAPIVASHAAIEMATRSFDEYVLARHSMIDDASSLLEMDSTLGDLFECLSLTHVLRLFALALLEKKIVLVASSYSVLLASGQALRALLHPLKWSHVFVPVLPLALKGCLHCPTPFIFGLHDAYVRRCELPKPSVDLVVVNLDRDTLTGGGDVFLPPVRHATLHTQLSQLCRPHLAARDNINGHEARASTEFPAAAVRRAFRTQLDELLAALEPCVSRFEFADKRVSVVDTNSCKGLWPADSARFCSALLHTQAVSTQLASRLGKLV